MSADRYAKYPEPLVYQPMRPPHEQSLIILHGRGSNARAFGPELLVSQPFGDSADSRATLRDIFPHAAFIFPTAAPRRARSFARSSIHQVGSHSPRNLLAIDAEAIVVRSLEADCPE